MAIMRRKLQPKPEAVVPSDLLERAKRSISTDRLTTGKCSVCGAETTSVASERLCWVCKRLKISAWKDMEQQIPMQE